MTKLILTVAAVAFAASSVFAADMPATAKASSKVEKTEKSVAPATASAPLATPTASAPVAKPVTPAASAPAAKK